VQAHGGGAPAGAVASDISVGPFEGKHLRS